MYIGCLLARELLRLDRRRTRQGSDVFGAGNSLTSSEKAIIA